MSLVPSLLQAIVHVDGEALVMHAGDKPYVVSPTGQIDLASRGLALDAVNGIVNQLLPTDLQHALEEFGAVQYELPAVAEFPGELFTIVAARGGDDLWVEIRRRRIPEEDQIPEDFFPPREVAATAQPYPVYASAGSPHLGTPVEPSSDSLELQTSAEMFDESATAGDGSHRAAVAPRAATHEVSAGSVVAAGETVSLHAADRDAAGAGYAMVASETVAAATVVPEGVDHTAADDVAARQAVALEALARAVSRDVAAPAAPAAPEAAAGGAAAATAHDIPAPAQSHAAAEAGWSDRAESSSAQVGALSAAAPPPPTSIAPPSIAAASIAAPTASASAFVAPPIAPARDAAHTAEPIAVTRPVPGPEPVVEQQPRATADAHAREAVRAPEAVSIAPPTVPPPARAESVAEISPEPIRIAPPPASQPVPAPGLASPPAPPAPVSIAPPVPASSAATVIPSAPASLSASAAPSAPIAEAVAASAIVSERDAHAPVAATVPEQAAAREPIVARVSGFAPKPVMPPVPASESATREPFASPEPIAIPPPIAHIAAAPPTPPAYQAFVAASAPFSASPASSETAAREFIPTPDPVAIVPTAERPVSAVWSTLPREVAPASARESVIAPEPAVARTPAGTPTLEPTHAMTAATTGPAATQHSELEDAVEYVVVPEPIIGREPERARIGSQPDAPAAAATSEPAPPRPPIAMAPPQPAVVLSLSRNPIRPEQQPLPSLGDDPTMSGLDRLLRLSAARGASTLYLSSESRPAVRVDGDLQTLEGEPVLAARDVESLLLTLMPERNHEALRTGAATEWICDIDDVGRVRCMSFRDHRGPGGVFRLMPTRSISADQLGLPKVVQGLAIEPKGLVLVAGPRSSGKRTLMSAFVDLINRTRRDHVITIEREINIVHERGSSFISQREVRGNDDDLLAAARAALREDPDVLMIEDLRTAGLMNVALEAAASGHLVVGGFAAHSATAAIDHIIDLYAPENRRQVQFALADSLRGVIVQVLLKKRGGGRVAGREVLLNTAAVSSVIAEGKTSQLPMALEGGRRYGMMPLNDALIGLVQQGTVDARDAYRYASDRPGLLAALKRYGLDTSFAERLA